MLGRMLVILVVFGVILGLVGTVIGNDAAKPAPGVESVQKSDGPGQKAEVVKDGAGGVGACALGQCVVVRAGVAVVGRVGRAGRVGAVAVRCSLRCVGRVVCGVGRIFPGCGR